MRSSGNCYTVEVELEDPANPRPKFADECRKNGWGPGTLLVGDEGYGPTVIKVTAVGETNILARMISHKGRMYDSDRESSWRFDARRNWKEFGA